MSEILRIGNASGYWGDDLSAFRRQIEGGPIDVVTMDFLAEITMSILQKQLARRPDAGYARDFVDQVDEMLDLIVEDGLIRSPHANQAVRYEEVVRPGGFGLAVDPDAPTKPSGDLRVVGSSGASAAHPSLAPDVAGLLSGARPFVHDLSEPGMLHARVVRPPHYHVVHGWPNS